MDIKADPTLEEFMADTAEYCVTYDFEPENALPDEMSWTTQDKWFCSGLAIKDMKELMWAN